ncbi:hypothetical protein Leryth_023710, partial [Lithospermum erythrorhizon]
MPLAAQEFSFALPIPIYAHLVMHMVTFSLFSSLMQQ